MIKSGSDEDERLDPVLVRLKARFDVYEADLRQLKLDVKELRDFKVKVSTQITMTLWLIGTAITAANLIIALVFRR